MIDENQFRFDWETLFETKFLLPSQGNVTCVFSKAYIQDIDLINMGLDGTEQDRAGNNELSAETVLESGTSEQVRSAESDEATEALNAGDVDPADPTQPEHASELSTSEWNADCKEPEEEQCSLLDIARNNKPSLETILESGSSQPVGSAEFDEATVEEASDVGDVDPADPTQPEYAVELATSARNAHYQEPTRGQCSYVSNKRTKAVRARLKAMSFEDYWEVAGSYLVEICKANDFTCDMVVDTIRVNKPDLLIHLHLSKNPIRGVARMLPAPETMEDDEYQVAYERKVKELAEKDFYKQRANDTTAKCRLFLHKLTGFGYVHGFEHVGSGEANIAKKRPSEDCANFAEQSSERKLPCYDGMELFTDVEYQAYESVYFGNQQMPKFYKIKGSRNEFEDASEEPSGHEEPPADLKDFDFGFKPERDAALIAKDADKVMKGDKEIMKYWFQRYRLFSKLNSGVLMDREGWFSVTPEHIGAHIADRMVTRPSCVILDAFTGVGGNAIQFALKGAYVIAVDLDPVRLRCALQNARVYGVADYITFICGNFFHVAKSFFGARQAASDGDDDAYYGIDAVFLSPPWGGPSYLQEKVYDLDKQEPNGYEIFRVARKISPNIGYFLPRNTSVKQLISLAGPGGRVEVEHDVLNGKTKTLTAYFGDLVAS